MLTETTYGNPKGSCERPASSSLSRLPPKGKGCLTRLKRTSIKDQSGPQMARSSLSLRVARTSELPSDNEVLQLATMLKQRCDGGRIRMRDAYEILHLIDVISYCEELPLPIRQLTYQRLRVLDIASQHGWTIAGETDGPHRTHGRQLSPPEDRNPGVAATVAVPEADRNAAESSAPGPDVEDALVLFDFLNWEGSGEPTETVNYPPEPDEDCDWR
ncbi:hypothetical protein J437_LFUL011039 [Ladona fulva]|uniref:Uncharacterized protein n=1 Tax=Ladona fulva TaxID=123851 RepID=A0A8K0KDJ9_LADFU|nr:hypothetical protein J437_LFUL011039 [Ladona fulva]